MGTGWNNCEVMAWPGELVRVYAPSSSGDRIFHVGSASGITLRGLRFIDEHHNRNFALYGNAATNITIVQCWFTGFRRGGLSMGWQNRNFPRPWFVNWCRIWENTWENRRTDGSGGAMGSGGWGRGILGDLSDGSVIRRNWVWRNWGEGIGVLAAGNSIIEDNWCWDNWSTDIYMDNVFGTSGSRFHVRRNVVGGSAAAFRRASQVGILLGNESYGGSGPYVNIPGTDWVRIEDNQIRTGRTSTIYYRESGAPAGPGANTIGHNPATFDLARNTMFTDWNPPIQSARNVSPWGA
jgi:hypothetical protein